METNKRTKIVYPGSFDPITKGHIDNSSYEKITSIIDNL